MTDNLYQRIIIVGNEIKGRIHMNNIVIYTSNGCSYCHDAKKFLNENNLPYIEHNISEDREAKKELIKKGVMSVPYIIINNQEVRGFYSEEIRTLLNL